MHARVTGLELPPQVADVLIYHRRFGVPWRSPHLVEDTHSTDDCLGVRGEHPKMGELLHTQSQRAPIDPRAEFSECERLGEVVVGAGVEAEDAVFDRVAGRQPAG